MNSLISIIIPTYNRAHLIGETLDSVLIQTYSNWQCIIIDDGSTDNSVEVIQKYLDLDSRFLFFSRPDYKKKGPSACRNFGLLHACGGYILFLDSDDMLAQSCLENRITFALKNREYDFWIFKMSAFENSDRSIKFVCGEANVEDENSWSKKRLMKGVHPFMITGPLWKSEVLSFLGGFNEELALLEDLDLHLRSLKEGFRLKYANQLHSDCFCRKDSFRKESYAKFSLKNHFLFFKNHLDKNESETVIFFCKVFNSLVFREMSFFYFFKFYNLGAQKYILKTKNGFYGLIILFYNITRLSSLKGFGYNYFKTQFNNF